MGKYQKTDLEIARDELMSHVHRCNVLQATEEQQQEWLKDTIQYMSERFPGMGPKELEELRLIGQRFCQPVIPHGKRNTALSTEDEGVEAEEEQTSESDATEQGELAGAA